MPLPDYTLLQTHFPASDPITVKNLIGGNVRGAWIKNVCVIRVSRALNYSGDPIPFNRSYLSTVRGGDGKRYAYRVREFRRYMVEKYGDPTRVAGGGSPPKSFKGLRGIILFDVTGWSDATGHADLWNGSGCSYQCYWPRADKVELWQA
ncbi:MAG: type VI secretion system amidase effector protein Tae4 [Acidobacteriota bacterium]|nr:type VI secretion system amidase effector protein Tae4 [Acidobacteriota bacterium]